MYLDSYKTKEKSLNDLIKAYEQAKIWIENKGIRVNVSRFKKNIELIKNNSFKNLKEDYDILWATAELHDIFEIHKWLSKINSNGLTESLKKCVKGHELLRYEKSDGGSVQGRNFTFELYAAARIAKGGYEVSFDTDADINFIERGRLFHVECKRVNSENKMNDLINGALSQINRRCENSASDRGIVALSISKIIFKAIEIEAKKSYANVKEMQSLMRAALFQVSERIQVYCSPKSTKSIGLLLHYKVPFRDINTGMAVLLNRFAMINFDNGYENNQLASAISNRLEL